MSTDLTDAPSITAAADRLMEAAVSGVPCAPVRDLIDANDIEAAYAVQQRLTAARLAAGATVVGRKIGLTAPAVQAQLGVDRPDFGVLFDDMGFPDGATVPWERLLQPKAEAEIAFVLDADLVEGPFDADSVRAAVGAVVPAIEIVDSRVAGWDIRFADTVADNASSGLYVLGAARKTLAQIEPAEVTMTMTRNDELVSEGEGTACLGDPLAALAWLAQTAAQHGEPLRAGQVILSGALGPMAPVGPGDVVTADIRGLGTVTATFSSEGE